MAPVPCTAKSLPDTCATIARLRARCEEPSPIIQMLKHEAEDLIADHLALQAEVQRHRKTIRGWLKQDTGKKSLKAWE